LPGQGFSWWILALKNKYLLKEVLECHTKLVTGWEEALDGGVAEAMGPASGVFRHPGRMSVEAVEACPGADIMPITLPILRLILQAKYLLPQITTWAA
jgi:hypothetical protein